MKKICLTVSFLLSFCFLLFCGCSEKSNSDYPNQEDAYSAEMWCYNEMLKSFDRYIGLREEIIIFYDIHEMTPTEDYLKLINDNEIIKCFRINMIASHKDRIDTTIDFTNYFYESNVIIIYQNNGSNQIFEDEIVMLSGVLLTKNDCVIEFSKE